MDLLYLLPTDLSQKKNRYVHVSGVLQKNTILSNGSHDGEGEEKDEVLRPKESEPRSPSDS